MPHLRPAPLPQLSRRLATLHRTGPDQRLAIAVLAAAIVCGLILTAMVIIRSDSSAAGLNTRSSQLSEKLDRLFAHSLAIGMSTREYGAVQQYLDEYQSDGLLKRAVVVDRKRRVVAAVAAPETMQIGSTLLDAPVDGVHRIRLLLRSMDYGELIVWPSVEPVSEQDSGIWMLVGLIVAAVIAWFCAITLLLYLRQTR